MITHPTPTGWQIIYQRAHALLGAQIIAHWHPDLRPAYARTHWQATLAAIAQHDDAGREWEGENLLTPAGAPKDFRISEANTRQPRLSVQHAQYQGRYLALLQSMHVSTLYADFIDQPDFAPLLAEMTDQQQVWRRALGLKKADADACYRLLKWADSCSLILCQRHLPTDGRAIEIETGPDGRSYLIRVLPSSDGHDPRAAAGDTQVTVDPWPFEPPAFTVQIESTQIDGLTFARDADLVAAMQAGTITPLIWHFSRA